MPHDISSQHSELGKRQRQCLVCSMGKIGQKDFGEPHGLNEILEECHVIDGQVGQSLDRKGSVRTTHTLSSQCHWAAHSSHCLLKMDVLW